MDSRSALLARASLLALAGNAILAAGKLAVGLASGSLAVLGDGIDSSTDVVIALINLLAARIVDKPGDREHPYGHARAETLATTVLSFVVFFAGAQLLARTAGSIIGGEDRAMPSPIAIYVTIASIAGKLLLSWSQFHYGRKTGSSMLVANGKNMRGDVVISASVLAGLGFTFAFGLPVIDRVAALLVSLWIIKVAIGIFLEVNDELMDGSADESLYARLFEAVASVPGAGNPHRARMRRLGSSLVADLDIEVDSSLSVGEAHGIALGVEAAVKALIPDIYDVIVHVEPAGNEEEGERYGLRPGERRGGA
ncbi:MAG TPA: cation diffusion facilitator family transporter [Spirochaetales bacterium]|nr:cation diffusion facilitator family transporter [Spirochaetales bacterium]HRY55843.1 cation diffusion facilitator family transporter [Spirochaetia bacterium]HRZ65022.1 cation diffusion facilitator family transporter [Spirochaetia bacterium]